jgi:DNA-binding transcriptional LysR family regulator
MFSISDLAAFVAVADGGSVRHAATTLGRTQPAVTQAIQRLEHVVGFPLLDRSGYRAVPTERGQTFLKRARAVVLQSRELKAFAGVLARDAEPGIRIAMHGATPPTVYDRLLGPVAQRFPDTVLEIESGEGNAPLR